MEVILSVFILCSSEESWENAVLQKPSTRTEARKVQEAREPRRACEEQNSRKIPFDELKKSKCCVISLVHSRCSVAIEAFALLIKVQCYSCFNQNLFIRRTHNHKSILSLSLDFLTDFLFSGCLTWKYPLLQNEFRKLCLWAFTIILYA